MGRPRGFDEEEVVRAAVAIFARRPYDGVSVDDLVTSLGVHRNSLYKTFGSKRGLYLAALRWHLRHDVRPLLDRLADEVADAVRQAVGADLDLLLMATLEQAPVDPEVAAEVSQVWHEFDRAMNRTAGEGDPVGMALTATVIGLRLRGRAGASPVQTDAAGALVGRLRENQTTERQ
jgi:TetR/AcrR family transcriptional repressor of nem operon